MNTKRKSPASISCDSPSAKRPCASLEESGDETRSKSPKPTSKYPQSDPTFGQKHAFPGLDDVEDELFYGPPEDGFEYLRMVRSEAMGLPAIFIAQERLVDQQKTTANECPSFIGPVEPTPKLQYANGVYAALSITTDPTKAVAPESEPSPDPQELYYNLLRHRFRLLRSTLKCVPPAEAIAALDETHPISLPYGNKQARQQWRCLLQSEDPKMVQIACMHPEDVLRVLAVVTRSISDAIKSEEIARVTRLAAWAWGLLGRCREVGEMGSEDVANIRELGKRAVKILLKLREIKEQGSAPQLQADSLENDAESSVEQSVGANNSGPGLENENPALDEESELEIAKARLRARLASSFSEETHDTAPPASSLAAEEVNEEVANNNPENAELQRQTHVMLDMIINIVGEFYGQTDLLEARDFWEEGDLDWSGYFED